MSRPIPILTASRSLSRNQATVDAFMECAAKLAEYLPEEREASPVIAFCEMDARDEGFMVVARQLISTEDELFAIDIMYHPENNELIGAVDNMDTGQRFYTTEPTPVPDADAYDNLGIAHNVDGYDNLPSLRRTIVNAIHEDDADQLNEIALVLAPNGKHLDPQESSILNRHLSQDLRCKKGDKMAVLPPAVRVLRGEEGQDAYFVYGFEVIRKHPVEREVLTVCYVPEDHMYYIEIWEGHL